MNDGHISTKGAGIHYIQDGAGPDMVWIPAGDR